jgi:putative membrane protein
VTVETVADRRLHPATLFVRFIKRAPEFVLGLPALVGFASDANIRKILLIAALGAIVSFAASLLSWLRFRYGVGERDIVIESGILNRQRRIIPFDRIQDVDIEQRFLSRLLGTARVRIETGGGGKDEGSLDTIHLAEAHRIRDIVRRAAVLPSEPEAAIDDVATTEPLLFEMPLPRLLLAGLFNFSLFFLAVVGASFQYLQPLLERNLGNLRKWIVPAGEAAGQIGIYVTLLLLALMLLLGVVTGVIRTVARDYRFRLSRVATGFRRRRGLFTLSEVLIPLRRVQLAVVGSGWLRRRLGWYSLQFQTLGADAQQSGHQPAAPFARMGEILPILAEAGIGQLPAEDSYIRVSRRAVLRQYLGAILPLVLLVLAASLVWPAALLGLLPLAPIAALAVLQWRRHRYVLGDGALYIREGLLRYRLWIVPYGKAQTISVTRSPLQRRFGLSSVTVDTAGASMLHAPVVRDLEAPVAEALAARLLDEYRAARSLPIRSST